MGQSYSVSAKLKFKSDDRKDRFCQIIRDYIAAGGDKGTAVFNTKDLDMNEPFDCFRALTAHDAWIEDDVYYIAEFHGSYAWMFIMEEGFTRAARTLADGSYIDMMGWDDATVEINVNNGRVYVRTDEGDDYA